MMSIIGNESLLIEAIVVGIENNDADGTVSLRVRQDHEFDGKRTPYIVARFSFVNEISLSGRVLSGVAEIHSVVGVEKMHAGGVGPYFDWSITIDELEVRFSSSGHSLELVG